MDKTNLIKGGFYTIAGAIGGCFGNMLGGFDKVLIALLFCMAADYITGLIVAIVFNSSTKTETGGAQSKAGFVGLVKKIFILILIVVINQIDIVLGTNGFFRNAAIIGFMANEALSLVENAGLMGIKLPGAVTNAVDVLKKKSESKE